MRDPRCWREVFIRGGMTTILVAVFYFALDLDPWIWLVPVGIVALVLLRWAVRPSILDGEGEMDGEGDDIAPNDSL